MVSIVTSPEGLRQKNQDACGCRVIKDCGLGLTPSGYYMCAIAGGIDRIFDLKVIPQENCSFVRFESDHLNFPVTGISDVMPYNSSLFKTLKGKRLNAYKKAFGQVLQQAVGTYKPDIIHTHHLFLLTALVRELFPGLPIVTTCHGTDLRQYNNCKHLRRFVKNNCQ